ncbi:hypothetical protein MHBO_000578 [Bonamia ostreae]
MFEEEFEDNFDVISAIHMNFLFSATYFKNAIDLMPCLISMTEKILSKNTKEPNDWNRIRLMEFQFITLLRRIKKLDEMSKSGEVPITYALEGIRHFIDSRLPYFEKYQEELFENLFLISKRSVKKNTNDNLIEKSLAKLLSWILNSQKIDVATESNMLKILSISLKILMNEVFRDCTQTKFVGLDLTYTFCIKSGYSSQNLIQSLSSMYTFEQPVVVFVILKVLSYIPKLHQDVTLSTDLLNLLNIGAHQMDIFDYANSTESSQLNFQIALISIEILTAFQKLIVEFKKQDFVIKIFSKVCKHLIFESYNKTPLSRALLQLGFKYLASAQIGTQTDFLGNLVEKFGRLIEDDNALEKATEIIRDIFSFNLAIFGEPKTCKRDENAFLTISTRCAVFMETIFFKYCEKIVEATHEESKMDELAKPNCDELQCYKLMAVLVANPYLKDKFDSKRIFCILIDRAKTWIANKEKKNLSLNFEILLKTLEFRNLPDETEYEFFFNFLRETIEKMADNKIVFPTKTITSIEENLLHMESLVVSSADVIERFCEKYYNRENNEKALVNALRSLKVVAKLMGDHFYKHSFQIMETMCKISQKSWIFNIVLFDTIYDILKITAKISFSKDKEKLSNTFKFLLKNVLDETNDKVFVFKLSKIRLLLNSDDRVALNDEIVALFGKLIANDTVVQNKIAKSFYSDTTDEFYIRENFLLIDHVVYELLLKFFSLNHEKGNETQVKVFLNKVLLTLIDKDCLFEKKIIIFGFLGQINFSFKSLNPNLMQRILKLLLDTCLEKCDFAKKNNAFYCLQEFIKDESVDFKEKSRYFFNTIVETMLEVKESSRKKDLFEMAWLLLKRFKIVNVKDNLMLDFLSNIPENFRFRIKPRFKQFLLYLLENLTNRKLELKEVKVKNIILILIEKIKEMERTDKKMRMDLEKIENGQTMIKKE